MKVCKAGADMPQLLLSMGTPRISADGATATATATAIAVHRHHLLHHLLQLQCTVTCFPPHEISYSTPVPSKQDCWS